MIEPKFYSSEASDQFADIGPRSAAVLTFSGNSANSIVKELTQNSLDARIDRKGNLKIRVSKKEVTKSQIPDFDNFERTLGEMEKYWNSKSSQYSNFFKTAKDSIKGKNVTVFCFEDFLTSGLNGDDYEGTFKTCVNDENVSVKNNSDSLGNHGIGKNSVFGFSGVQTVFYTSLNQSKEYKFKGVSKLGTYKDSHGTMKSDRMYYGENTKNGVRLISDPKSIPQVFMREEEGLSQFVLGAELPVDWDIQIKKAFIKNYWLLFEMNKLEVVIQEDILNNENYLDQARILFDGDTSKENPLPFIETLKHHQILETQEIHKLGNIKFYVKEQKENDLIFPNKVVFLRDGMMIKMDNLGVGGLPSSIAGVMYCDNEKGNSILGAMEPHAHDNFYPELVKKKEIRGVTVADAEKALKEIDRFKKDVIRKIKEQYTTETNTVDFVDQLFSDIFNSGRSSGAGKDDESDKETFSKKIKALNFDTWFNSNQRNSSSNLNDETSFGEGEGPGVGTGTGGKGIKGGKGKSRSSSGGAAGPQRRPGKIKHNFKSRFFLAKKTNEETTYNLVIRSEENIQNMDVIIGQKGDAKKGNSLSGEIKHVVKDGIPVDFIKNISNDDLTYSYSLKGIRIEKNKPNLIEIKIKEKKPSALTIIETK